MHAVYAMSVTSWGHPSALPQPPTSISVTFHLGILIPPLLETFYLWRLHKLFGRARLLLDALRRWLLFVVQEGRLGYVYGVGRAADRGAGDGGGAQRGHRGRDGVVSARAEGYGGHVVSGSDGDWGIADECVGCVSTKMVVDRLLMWTLQTGVITAVTYFITLIVVRLSNSCGVQTRLADPRVCPVYPVLHDERYPGLDGDTGYYHENFLELFTVLLPRNELLVDAARFPPTQETSQKSIVINISREYTVSSTSPDSSENINGVRVDPEPVSIRRAAAAAISDLMPVLSETAYSSLAHWT
ncbi:hypothetical protein CCMSSC00406_0009459 [Pleurotus cornucopiae]|uniref:Uncharacterized protein n=1 Tax=Pleurotus cornucopiae TaxID=5321 RepID=A0ACB7J1U5_PLECO|nr:hypothetical protein CCMSSC00406_0009459 [Pleurotus cornucopiae]